MLFLQIPVTISGSRASLLVTWKHSHYATEKIFNDQPGHLPTFIV